METGEGCREKLIMPLPLPRPESISQAGHVSTNTASTSQKRPTTARMHTVPQRKKARTNDSGIPALVPGAWQVKTSIGEYPPYTDYANWVEDPSNNMIYTFGGTYPGDEDNIPISNFYSCDTISMRWYNLTDKLRFRDPLDPFGATELRREEQELPPLSQPGSTLVRIHGTTFVFIFGGYSLDEGEPVSTLIAVDVEHREWWYVQVEGGPVAARIKPVVVAIDHRIYIFSGYGKYSKANPLPFRSYSIACYQSALRRWTWEARDVPYSNGFVPPDQFFEAGVAVYNGKKIMLTPGKALCSDEPLDFTEQKIFYFHTEHRQFQMAPHLGDYPKEVLWYSIHKSPSSLSLHPRQVSLSPRNSGGRPPKNAPRSSGGVEPTPPITSTSPSIILCAWVPRPNSKYAVPELWRLSLSHNDEIRCLNKSQQIWDLNHDFQGCVAADDRLILLGNDNPKGEEAWNIYLDVVFTPEDREDKLRD